MPWLENYMEWLGLGVNVTAFYFVNKYYKSCLRHADNVENAPEYDVGPKLFHDLKESEKKFMPYVSVQGIVEPIGLPLDSQYKEGHQGVIREIYMATHKSRRTNGNWGNLRDVIKSQTEHVPFHLASDHSNNIKMKIEEPMSASHVMNSLVVTHDHFEPNKDGALQRTLDRLFGEINKGFQETEKMLQVGVPMLGIGKLTLKDGKMFLGQPSSPDKAYILTTLSRKEILNQLHNDVHSLRVFRWVLGIMGVALLSYGIYRCAKIWIDKWNEYQLKKSIRRLREEREMAQRQSLNERAEARGETMQNDGDFDMSRTCVACLTKEREVLLLECGHICLCGDCALLLPRPKTCPVCRQNIDRIVPAYFP